MINFSKQTFTEMLNKINISECYDSKRLPESKNSTCQNSQMKRTLEKIHELYKNTQVGSGGKRLDFNA